MSQKIAALLTVDADAPRLTTAKRLINPSRCPNASRISDNAAATNATAITAAQDTPDEYAGTCE